MDSGDQPAAVSGSTHTLRTRVDGSLSITIEIEPTHAQAAFAMFGTPGTPVALARITPEAALQAGQQAQAKQGEEGKQKSPWAWGNVYVDLFRLGWFNNPRVAEAFGIAMETTTPQERESAIKNSLYDTFDVESLSDLDPLHFLFHCDALRIKETVPPRIIEAAKGRAI